MSGYEASTGPDEGRQSGVVHQDPLTVPDAAAVPVPFEIVVVSPNAHDAVDVTVCGMWTGAAPVLGAYDDDARVVLDVRGVDDGGRARPFRVTLTVAVSGQEHIVVRGVRAEERVAVADVGALAVVCGPDPMLAGIAPPFLHRRGDALVRVDTSGPGGGRGARRSTVNLVA